MTRPNVVLICVDEWRSDALSCAGHPYVETPHLDQLARGGVRFSRGYSATSTCVPARVALFTGQSQERHGRPVTPILKHTRERIAPAAV
jgi:arylsulfatase A-like enzyme